MQAGLGRCKWKKGKVIKLARFTIPGAVSIDGGNFVAISAIRLASRQCINENFL
jgi:hypothetical protein